MVQIGSDKLIAANGPVAVAWHLIEVDEETDALTVLIMMTHARTLGSVDSKG